MFVELSKWMEETFGESHTGDEYYIRRDTQEDKKANKIEFITIFLKKQQGFKRSWIEEAIFNEWKNQIKKIVGNGLLKIDLNSSEGNQVKYKGAIVKGDKGNEFKDSQGRLFNYNFNLQILRKVEG